ncbi:MAG: hypothetical protein J0H54_08245, partial [Rhizobiales bacterium]|nr:hypothetical protein [Hyphomicrobiales bacterium]
MNGKSLSTEESGAAGPMAMSASGPVGSTSDAIPLLPSWASTGGGLDLESFASGDYRESVAIEVPAFHGIEPSISLDYNSSLKLQYSAGGNGAMGRGWALKGIAVIERATRGGGAPRFDANDVYALTGEEMVDCVAGMVSPSCASGGTHTTRIESYNRIKFDSSANRWLVWARDGTRYEFWPVGQVVPASGDTDLLDHYRWLLKSVTDTHGNQASYSYVCDQLVNCGVSQISYGPVTIAFAWESRPDPFYYATGKN